MNTNVSILWQGGLVEPAAFLISLVREQREVHIVGYIFLKNLLG